MPIPCGRNNTNVSCFRLQKLQILLTLFLLISTHLLNVEAVCHVYSYNTDDCGVTEEVPGDIRTQIPWTAGIFLKSELDETYSFHATGTILSPTTVITVISGVLEKLPRKLRGKHPQSVYNSNAFLVAVGLSSGDLSGFDNHTQMSEVTFLEPYLGLEEPSREYHFVLIHLKTPLDFTTPYVKPICLSYFKLGRKSDGNKTMFLHGGFAKSKIKSQSQQVMHEETELKLQVVDTGTGYECVKHYEKYYNKHFPIGIFCARMPPKGPEDPLTPDSTRNLGCLMQGSSVIQRIDHKWYLTGLTSFIRGRKGGSCKNDTVYFNARLSTAMEWVERSIRCSPFSFSCSDGTCIPLESVCNSIRNCLDNGIDENEILCEANRKCGSNTNTNNGNGNLHQCNLVGGCISNEQICDGFRDCDGGSDESQTLCNKDVQGSRSSRDLSPSANVIQYCLPLAESEGVQVEYISINRNGMANCTFIPVSTFALSKCKSFYKSKNLYSHLEQQCNDNGKWSEQSKFECEPDCGMLNHIPTSIQNPNQSPTLPKSELNLPWHTLIFNLDQPTQKIKFICGGTLIEQQYIITAGHCFASHVSLKSYKVVLGAVSKNFSDNLSHEHPVIVEIDNVWRPDEFDIGSREGDVALVKLKRPVAFGAQIRPACYGMDEEPQRKSEANLISIALTGLHVSNFPEVADMACISKDFRSENLGFRCAGHLNGTVVKQIDTGGGLVSPSRTKFGSRFVLRGIMSQEEAFDTESSSLFSSLEKYRYWISEVINQ